jgi:hypothetical protein
MILSHKRMTMLSAPLRHGLLTACDPHLPVSERLRYRTCTTTPRLPEPESALAAERARHIPQHLWQDWIIRFQPPKGTHVDALATDLPAALLISGNPTRNIHATDELNPWTQNTSQTLRVLADHHPDALTAICALADHLDTHGSPIDYRRRRATFTDVTLTREQWLDLCTHAGSSAGNGARQRHARRYIFALLTGADLTNPQHHLAFSNHGEKSRYLGFLHTMTTPLRNAPPPPRDPTPAHRRHRRAADLEPTGRLHHRAHPARPRPRRHRPRHPAPAPPRGQPATGRHGTAAGHFVEHVRHALQRLHRAPTPVPKNTPVAARRLWQRATDRLTLDFFQREYLDARKDLRTLEAETGIHRKLLARHARQLGIRLTHDRRGTPIDPDWLRTQAEALHRTNSDIAAELGLTGETIRRHRKHLGIGPGPTGVHRLQIQHHPDLPDDIRRAVQGQRHGWQRLRRFQ